MPDAPSDDLLHAASAWFARLHGGDATDEDRRQHEAWLAEHRGHRAAYEYVSQSAAMAAHAATSGMSRGEDIGIAGLQRSPAAVRLGAGKWTLAAGLTVAVVLAGIIWHRGRPQEFFTEAGQMRTVALQDGSVLTLGPATDIAVSYRRTVRNLDLEKGEALFSVAKNPNRPFIVRAGRRTVEDIGTEFEIDRYGVSVNVAVSHGTVAISKLLGAPAGSPRNMPALLLRGGEAVSYSEGGMIGPKYSVDPGQVGAWRGGLLVYEQAPFARVVADLNRQFGGNVAISDPKLASLSVTLTLKLRDRDATLRTLQQLLPVRALHGPSGDVRFQAATSTP